MFFLLRTAFWLSLVILILPTDSEKQSEVYGTAEAAVQDLSGFCTRNPDACAKAGAAFSNFGEKAEFGAKMLMDFFAQQGETAVPAATPGAPGHPAPLVAPQPAPSQPQMRQENSSNTLTGDDLKPGWSFGRRVASDA